MPYAYLYVEPKYNIIQINSSFKKFSERLINEIFILRGLTKTELDNKVMVYHYVSAVKDYYLD